MSSESSPSTLNVPAAAPAELRLTFHTEPGGDTRVALMEGERSVSRLWIVPLTLRIGAATVRMDGIGGVGTEEDCRNRGYSRRVLEATLEHMRQGDASLSMLYGIPDFYPKFGYATAGPDHFVWLTRLSASAELPTGWRVRPFVPADLPSVRRLYDENTAAGVGCALRSEDRWERLTDPKEDGKDDCRVVVDPTGQVRAYAWRARWHWYADILEGEQPEAMVIAEVMADGPAAADALLAACRRWGTEVSARRSVAVERVVLPLPPEHRVAAAAMYQSASIVHRFQPCGSSMARVLDVGRLLDALRPELARRLQAAGSRFTGTLRLRTEVGAAGLAMTPDGVAVVGVDGDSAASRGGQSASKELELRLPQSVLARLALGAFPPGELLDRLEQPPDATVRGLVETLFPLRHPHLYLPDRF